jgi:hypothetical protein
LYSRVLIDEQQIGNTVIKEHLVEKASWMLRHTFVSEQMMLLMGKSETLCTISWHHNVSQQLFIQQRQWLMKYNTVNRAMISWNGICWACMGPWCCLDKCFKFIHNIKEPTQFVWLFLYARDYVVFIWSHMLRMFAR